MLKKILIDHGEDLVVLVFFLFSFTVFLYVIARVFLMKRHQIDAEASLPFQDEPTTSTRSTHEHS